MRHEVWPLRLLCRTLARLSEHPLNVLCSIGDVLWIHEETHESFCPREVVHNVEHAEGFEGVEEECDVSVRLEILETAEWLAKKQVGDDIESRPIVPSVRCQLDGPI
jgi:hypothetical protein